MENQNRDVSIRESPNREEHVTYTIMENPNRKEHKIRERLSVRQNSQEH